MVKTEGDRQTCISLLSCIGAAPRYFLPLSDEFHRRFNLISCVNCYAPSIPEQMASLREEIQNADVLIYHSPEWLPILGDQYERFEALISELPESLIKISYPLPHCHVLWPFHANDPRNNDPERTLNRHGQKPDYPYGDSFVLDLLEQGIPKEEVISRYLSLEVSNVVDLDQLKNSTISLIERNDEVTTVKVAEYVEHNFRKFKLFDSINHAANHLNLFMVNEVLRALEIPALPQNLLDQTREIVVPSVPIHPSIARYFDLSYSDEETRYHIDALRNMTFAEYIRAYVYFS